MSRTAVLYVCKRCDVAMAGSRCWICGDAHNFLTRISVDLPSSSPHSYLHLIPKAEPYNITANALRLIAALQVEDDIRIRAESRGMAMPLVLAMGPHGKLTRAA